MTKPFETKEKILNILAEEPQDMNSIKKELDLCLSTISAHINWLMENGYIEIIGKKWTSRRKRSYVYARR